MHLDPKPKDSDSEEEANVERKKPEGSRLAQQREKQVGNTSDVSCLSIKGVKDTMMVTAAKTPVRKETYVLSIFFRIILTRLLFQLHLSSERERKFCHRSV